MPDRNIDDIYALAPMQRLMLTHTMTATGSHALANQFRYEISGGLDEERFRKAWQRLIERHGALRTAFLWEGLREPVQVVRTRVDLPYEYSDLSGLEEENRTSRLRQLIKADRNRQFDVRRAPLMRVTLARLEPHRWTMIWSRHHLILDRWCVDLLFDELFAIYDDPDITLDPAGSFRDYVHWISNQDNNTATRYWRGALRDVKQPTLLFPKQHGRTAVISGGLPVTVRDVAPDVLAALAALARSQHTTLASVLQAAVAVMIAALTGSRRVVFGLTVAGRPASLPNIETTMGSFINNVPVALNVDPAQKLDEWLPVVHAHTVARVPFEHVSPADVHTSSELPRNLPMFDLLTLLHAPAIEQRTGPGFDIEQVDSPLDSAYPFTLSLAETMGIMQVMGAYDPATVTADFARGLIGALSEVLEKFARKPDARLLELYPSPETICQLRDACTVEHDGIDRVTTRSTETLNVTAATMVEIWQQVLGLDSVGLDDDFFALGGTSIQAAMMFDEIEHRLGKALPLSVLFSAGSIRALLDAMERPQQRTSSVVAIQPHGRRTPLIVIPGIGGNVVGLEELARAFGRDQPFFGLQSKGLDGEDNPVSTIEEIASGYIGELSDALPVGVEKPYVLLGICWGALVALERARQLDLSGQRSALLILMDPVIHSPTSPVYGRLSRASIKARFILDRLKLYRSTFAKLDSEQRRAWIRDKGRTLVSMIRTRDPFHGLTNTLNQQWVTASNLQAIQRYNPKPYAGEAYVLLTDRPIGEDEQDPRTAFGKTLGHGTNMVAVPGHDTGDAIVGGNAVELARIIESLADAASESDQISG